MSEIKTGWLNDSNGDIYAPKTLVESIQNKDGVPLEDLLCKIINSEQGLDPNDDTKAVSSKAIADYIAEVIGGIENGTY